MKTAITVLLLSLCHFLNAQTDLLFQSDSFHLDDSSRILLSQHVSKIDLNRAYTVVLKGHTDQKGSEEYNYELSIKRNESVKAFLLSKGLDESKIVCQEFGEMDLKVSEGDLHLNRRVEIQVLQEEFVHNTAEELFELIAPKTQKFCFKPESDTTIFCQNKSQIYLPANAFDLSKIEKPIDCVEIEVVETIKKSDMLMANLTTTSNDQIIESGGMLEIRGFCKGQEVFLKSDMDVSIAIPTESNLNNAQLFDGHFDANNNINWIPNGAVNFVSQAQSASLFSDCERVSGGFTRCPLFFCRIGNALGFKSRRGIRFQSRWNGLSCERLADLYKEYGVDNMKDFFEAYNRSTDNRYEVADWEDYVQAERMENIRKINEDYANIKFDDLSYFVFQTSDLGWRNVDCFTNFPSGNKESIFVDVQPAENIDVKLVWLDQNIIISPFVSKNEYIMNGVPNDIVLNLVAIKYENNQPYLCIKEVRAGQEYHSVEFEKVSLAQLKSKMRILDKKNELYSEN